MYPYFGKMHFLTFADTTNIVGQLGERCSGGNTPMRFAIFVIVAAQAMRAFVNEPGRGGW